MVSEVSYRGVGGAVLSEVSYQGVLCCLKSATRGCCVV